MKQLPGPDFLLKLLTFESAGDRCFLSDPGYMVCCEALLGEGEVTNTL